MLNINFVDPRKILPCTTTIKTDLKGTVQRDGSGKKWSHFIDLYFRERRGDFQQISPAPDPIRALLTYTISYSSWLLILF